MEIIFVRHGQSIENDALLKDIAYDYNNIVLTNRGELQAKKTGKYLKIYGDFDIIYHSPLIRAVQTANIIRNELNYKKKLISSDLLIEIGDHDKLSGLSLKDRNDFLDNNKELTILEKKIKFEKNLFIKAKLQKQYNIIGTKYVDSYPGYEKHIRDSKKFLNMLKNQKYKRVLIVCHGGTIFTMSRLITNMSPYYNTTELVLREQTTRAKNPEPFIEDNNCIIMGILFEDKKFQLIIPPNNLHLKNMPKL